MKLTSETVTAKPFLKWAGGKSQLIPEIGKIVPAEFLSGQNVTYVEPFIGSGAVLFWVLSKFPDLKKAVINDINSDLSSVYSVIRDNPEGLINELNLLQATYKKIATESEKKEFYLSIRRLYNARRYNALTGASYLIFLNRTCFNGLYRVNSKNEFNVPFGRYVNPKISDPENILLVSKALQKVTILNGDFVETANYIEGQAFYYFDPPYRPLNKTAAFNSYSAEVFNDREQERLYRFCDHLHSNNHLWLLSNSDPKNIDQTDTFFDDLYAAFSIKRVNASRRINSNPLKRGEIKELLISNYG